MSETAKTKIKEWRSNPAQFVDDNFKTDLEPWQVEALQSSIGKNFNRIGMKACTGPGKSAVLAWMGWHRLVCFGLEGEHPKGVALSGEGRDNLRDNLWAELSKWQQRSEFLRHAFEWTGSRIYAKDHEETWFLSARSYAQNADAEAIGRSLSGLHSKFPFILLDEIGDMPVTVGQKASQIFTGGTENGLIAAAGNPTSNDGLLYDISTRLAEQWNIVTVTADPDDPHRTQRVDIELAREQISAYGRDNPWVMATILGLFPPSNFNALLSINEVEEAFRRNPRADTYEFSQKRIGVDVARFGDDRTILFPRQGLMSYKWVEMRNARSHEIAARVLQAKMKWGSESEFIDDTGGFGSGVIDSLMQSGHDPYPVHFASKPIDPRYFNKRSEMWFEMSEWVKRGGALPKDALLMKELTAPTYTFYKGKLRVEEKDQIKKRLGFSPDVGDALALTFALPEMPAAHYQAMEGPKMLSDYDPFDEKRL